MAWFRVTAPITGTIEIDVEADDENAAIAAAETAFTIDNVIDWEEDISRASTEPLYPAGMTIAEIEAIENAETG